MAPVTSAEDLVLAYQLITYGRGPGIDIITSKAVLMKMATSMLTVDGLGEELERA